ncbi:MAG: prolyl oligopeptidase family serine peptidase [Armatimonadetes bacterium]|nr:prolyl oligopeptidase family serine peptidase [Armatimonadota bacterium]
MRLCVSAVDCFAQTSPQNAALLAFKREQIAIVQANNERLGADAPPEYWTYLTQLKDRAAQIEKSTGDFASTPYNFHERAYFAPDGSPQPYWIALPSNYSSARKWPLVVYLHGYSDQISKVTPALPSPETLDGARRRGFIVAIPYGRRNSDFVQWGQDDVLRVKAEVLQRYAIDAERVFLAGTSMGGYGAYAVGLHTAGGWNAVAAISGRSDFYLWFKLQREALPSWKRALYDADDPRFLIRNARNTPFLVQHGALDTVVSPEHSRLIVADAKRLNLPFRYFEQPNGDHYDEFQFAAMERALDWFKTLPTPIPPRKIELVAVDLREASNAWARVEAFETYGESASLRAQIGDNAIEVETQNVARFILEPPQRYLRAGQKISLVVNGVEAAQLDPASSIVWEKSDAKLGKTPARCGPFKNALRDPFLLVYGDEKGRIDAQRFALEWKQSSDGTATIKAATQISTPDKANFNLILFGTRQTNPLIAEIADDLPLELTPEGYRRGEKTVAGQNLGVRMVWKSPWNAARLIGICSGNWWGEKLPVNHKWDLIPDYIVYSDQTDADDTNSALEAGFFDGNWQ